MRISANLAAARVADHSASCPDRRFFAQVVDTSRRLVALRALCAEGAQDSAQDWILGDPGSTNGCVFD